MESRKTTGEDVVSFVQAAFRLQQLRQDIVNRFESLAQIPENLEPALRLALMCDARSGLVRAVRDERRMTSEQASRSPAIIRYSMDTPKVEPPPAPVPVPIPVQIPVAPAPVMAPPPPVMAPPAYAPRFETPPPRHEPAAPPPVDLSSLNSWDSQSQFGGMRPQAGSGFGLGGSSGSRRKEAHTPAMFSSAVDRIFDAEISSNIDGVAPPLTANSDPNDAAAEQDKDFSATADAKQKP